MGMLDSILGGMLGNSAQQGEGEGSGRGKLMIALLPAVLSMLLNNRGNASGGGGLGDVLGNLLPGGNQQMSGGGLGGGLGGMLGGLLGGGAAGGLGSILGGLLAGGGSAGGGLGNLLEQFQQAGYGEEADSWVGTGQNMPISPEAIGQVIGSDALAQIAQQVGISQDEASAGLSELIPEVVNHLTPNGAAPDFNQLSASVSDLVRQLGGREG